MTPHRPIRRLATLVAAASLAVLLLPGLVTAHSELVSSVPAANAVVQSPFTGPIVLTFTEHLASGSKADLVDASGAIVASATVDANAKTMTFTLTTPLPPGGYEVRWVSIADDGDLLRQPVVPFTVAAAASPSPSSVASAEPSASAAATAVASAVPSVAPTAAPSPSAAGGDASGSGGDVVIPILVALIILGAGAAYLLTRRNRPADPT
jgi:methionine-rich copper-binding protein CopC